MAVTQINGQKAKQTIMVNGVEWHLKKDATDPSTVFPYQRMQWINAGCDKVTNNVYCCWVLGIIPPTMGTLEKPVSVFTLGFNSAFIPMSPQTIGQQDMMRMHYYTSEYGDFARQFVTKFLSAEQVKEITERPSMMPFPPPQIEEQKDETQILSIEEPKPIVHREVQI